MKKCVRCLVVLVMIIVMCAQVQVSVFAAGTNKNSATEVVADNQINYGTISKGGVNDWYYITTGESEEFYYFTLHNESGTENIHMIVYSARDEQLLDVGYYTSAGSEITSNIKLLPNAKYYLKVYYNDQGTGNYYFKIDKKIDLVGDSKEKANEIKINEKIDSSIDGNGDKDFFVFSTGDLTQEYKVSLTNISGTTNAHILIYSARDEQLLDVGYYTEAGASHEGVVTLNANSTYYAVAYLNDDGTGSYSFKISQCADGHAPSAAWVTTKDPTCTGAGERTKYCSVCKEILETEQVDAKGHSLGKWKIKVPATWISLGEKEAECEVCGEIETGRDWSKVWILPVIILGAIILIIGVVNYIKSFKRSRW